MTLEDMTCEVKERFSTLEHTLQRLEDAPLSEVSEIVCSIPNKVDHLKHAFHLLERKIEQLPCEDIEDLRAENEMYERIAHTWETRYGELVGWIMSTFTSQFGECVACDGSGCDICHQTGRIELPVLEEEEEEEA